MRQGWIIVALAGIAAAPQPLPIPVRVVTAEQRHHCEYLRLVTNWMPNPDGLNDALRSVLGKVAKAGGNDLYIVAYGVSETTATVAGEALLCPPDIF